MANVFFLNAQSVFDVIKNWNYGRLDCNWKAIACGDINGNGIDEFVGIKTDTSQLFVFSSPTYDKTLKLTGCLKQIDTTQNNFVGITVGKFIDYGDSTKQIAILRKTTDTASSNILIYRQLAYSDFQLVASGVSGSASWQWIACAAGDIDGDGQDELIVCKKDSSQFIAYSITLGGTFNEKGHINNGLNTNGPENDWRGIACKDFNNDGKAELISVREGNSTYPDVVMWSFSSGTFNIIKQYNPGGSLHYSWEGIATGKFKISDNSGSDFVLYKNSSPFFQYYHYDNSANSIDVIGSNDYNSDTDYPWVIAAGNTNINNSRDEVIALRNYSSADSANIDMIGDKFWGTYDQVNIQGARDADYNFDPDAAAAFVTDNNIQTIDFLISEYYVRNFLGASVKDPIDNPSIMGTEYQNFINFLDATKNTSIKVWITLVSPTEANLGGTNHSGSFPKYTGKIKNTSGTVIDETTYFNKIPSTAFPNPLDFWDTTYGGWFTLCNLIAKQYPNLTGIKIGDFSRYANLAFFHTIQPSNKTLLEEMYNSLKANNANIAFMPINYWTGIANAPDIPPYYRPWWEPYADGFVFPYCNMSSNQLPCYYDNSTTNTFYNEISNLKTWWNSPNKPIITSIYAHPLSCFEYHNLALPDPSYVETLIDYGKSLSDGVSIYCTQDPTTAIGCTVYTEFSAWADLPYNCDITVDIPNPDIYNNQNLADIENVRVFPNPATDNITVESVQPAVIEIYDMQGRLLKTFALSDNNINIDISSFPSGVFFVKVITKKGITVKKFVKE
ncbi:MAG: T9SS type A sorting domain-containing protein [Bacteroidota bacterium]